VAACTTPRPHPSRLGFSFISPMGAQGGYLVGSREIQNNISLSVWWREKQSHGFLYLLPKNFLQ